jgi:1,4-dihydroxy-2-naphthoate octaprenyltransferase
MNSNLKGYVLATRPWSFSMTIISVTLGSLLGLLGGVFHWHLYAMTVVGMVLVHAATNMINDYFDTKHGVDRPESPTAQYRPHPILTGSFKPHQILRASLVLYGAALGLGVALAALRGWVLMGFAAVGVLASVFYSGGPVNYKHRALGELSVFLMWGPLMVLGSYFIQTRSFDGYGTVLMTSIPQGMWVALVIFANNLKDIGYDEKTGVRTVANTLGMKPARIVFTVAIGAIYVLLVLLVVFRSLPIWTLAVAVSIPLSVRLVRSVTGSEEIPADADPQTAQTGMVFGLLLVAGFLMQQIVPL